MPDTPEMVVGSGSTPGKDLVRRGTPVAIGGSEIVGFVRHLVYNEVVRYVAIVEFKIGQIRGNHYHERRIETFYLVSGRLRGYFTYVNTEISWTMELKPGELITVHPWVAHAFDVIGDEDAVAIEIVRAEFDPSDVRPHNVITDCISVIQ